MRSRRSGASRAIWRRDKGERAPQRSRPLRRAVLGGVVLLLLACSSGPPQPAPLDTKNEQCGHCRMAVSDARFASQIVAPGELPRFFDDLGCLGGFLKAGSLPRGALVYVADHRTKEWLRAENAVYTRVAGLATPMSSHLIAHADAASRDADPDARGGALVALEEVFGLEGPPKGAR
jgi:copper chaperone NosL